MNLAKLIKAAQSAAERHPRETGCMYAFDCQDLQEIKAVQSAAETLQTHQKLVARILKGECI